MNSTWSCGGREYPFDISEAECMRSVGDALKKLKIEADELELREDVAPHETIAEQCGMIGRFFDEIFGDGEGEKICGEKSSLRDYSDAYVSFIVFLNAQVEEFAAMRESIERRCAERIAPSSGGHVL